MVRITPTGCDRVGLELAFSSCRAIPSRQRAFTLFELLLIVAIIAILAGTAWPGYQQYIDEARIAQTKVDIRIIESALENYNLENRAYPDALAQAGVGNMRDPWGHLYRYLRITPATNKGLLRKDRNLVPINSDYDLYSLGKNGQSKPPLTAAPSRDDVIRANNGRFVGLASDY
jgi:general secretion pathway protein G